MTRAPLRLALALVAATLVRPAASRAGPALEQIEKEYGVALEEQPADTCKLNNVAAPCYVPYPPGNVIVPAGTPDSLRRELDKAGVKKPEGPTVPISGAQAPNDKVCRAPIAEAYKKNDACLDHSYWGTQTWRQIGDKFAAVQKAHPDLTLDWNTTGCGTAQVGRFCVDVKDKEGKSLTEGVKAYDGDLAKLDDWVKQQSIKSQGGDVEAAKKACPPKDDKRSPRDLAELIAKKKERTAETGGLSAVDLLMVCASQDTGNDLASIGMTRDKAQGLMDLVAPKALPAKIVPAAGSDAAAIAATFFHNDPKMKQYFEKNPDKAKSFNDAYAGCSARKGRAADDCMVELQRNWLAANSKTPYAAIPEKFYKKAPGKRDLLQAIIDRQGWDTQMRERFKGNLDKMSASTFESNYAGVLDGRPVTSAGRQYLVNACQGLPDWSKAEALTTSELRGVCTRFGQGEARRSKTVPAPGTARRGAPSAVITPERRITRSVADALSEVRGTARDDPHSRYVNVRTRKPCDNPERDIDCVYRPNP